MLHLFLSLGLPPPPTPNTQSSLQYGWSRRAYPVETGAEAPEGVGFVGLDELSTYASLDGLVLLASPAGSNVWEPVEPDYNGGLIHHGLGLFASGFPLKMSPWPVGATSSCRFMFELNKRGDLTRANIRVSPPDGKLSPSYREAPYLLCMRDKILAVRYAPRRALILTLNQARADDAWSASSSTRRRAMRPSAAARAARRSRLHGCSRKAAIRLSETGDFVTSGGICDVYFAFAWPAAHRSSSAAAARPAGVGSPTRRVSFETPPPPDSHRKVAAASATSSSSLSAVFAGWVSAPSIVSAAALFGAAASAIVAASSSSSSSTSIDGGAEAGAYRGLPIYCAVLAALAVLAREVLAGTAAPRRRLRPFTSRLVQRGASGVARPSEQYPLATRRRRRRQRRRNVAPHVRGHPRVLGSESAIRWCWE